MQWTGSARTERLDSRLLVLVPDGNPSLYIVEGSLLKKLRLCCSCAPAVYVVIVQSVELLWGLERSILHWR